MPDGTTGDLNLWWFITLGAGTALALALGFVFVLFYHERTKRILERDKFREIQNLSQKMMQAQEEDRLRISRELHDEVGQTLTAIHTNLQVVVQDLPPDQESLLRRISESQSLAKEVTQRIRGVIRELRPVDFKDAGLIPSLTKYISDFEARNGIQTIFRHDPLEEELSLNHKVTIFRIIQESLTNIARHSKATEAQISLLEKVDTGSDDGIADAGVTTYLEICDNGRGMNPSAPNEHVYSNVGVMGESDESAPEEHSSGIGLLGIQERVKLLSGTFQITSSPEKGTSIIVTLPRGAV